MTSTKYSPADRLRAATALVTSGNSLRASEQTDIPSSTIRHWSQHDVEFKEMCEKVWIEFGAQIKADLAQIVKEAGRQTLDRLRNGDVVRDSRTGDLVRVPIKGRDAAIVGAVAFDKLRLAESAPTQIVEHQGSKEHLERLAQQFAELASSVQEREEFSKIGE